MLTHASFCIRKARLALRQSLCYPFELMAQLPPLRGIFTALATPFTPQGEVDAASYRKLVEYQITAGVQGLVPVGTTGESPTLDPEEHKRAIALCIEYAAGRVPVIAGAGANATLEAVSLARFAKQAGAQATLQVTPYYNKPTQEGLYAHFCTIAEKSDLPIMLYNVPARTSVHLEVPTVVRLVEDCPLVVALKDAAPHDLTRPAQLARAGLRDNFTLLSGEDASFCAFLAMGGDGCVSVASNLVPQAMVEVYNSYKAGDEKTMANLRDALMPLWQGLFCETSPAPVKYGLFHAGLFETAKTRLPLVEATPTARERVEHALAEVARYRQSFVPCQKAA